jgi:cyclopropane fatty-acyl-phospholipid synthase-like methyltransferase
MSGEWDKFFQRHKKNAEEKNISFEESIDAEWRDADKWFKNYILPFLPKEKCAICEIGPGSGRFSRYLVNNATQYYLVENSEYVCDLLKNIYGNKENVRVLHNKDSSLSDISDNSVDFIFSIGTFVHLYIEQIYGYFSEFHRVLKSGGKCVIHLQTFMSDEGYNFFVENLAKNGKYDNRSIFRFYHPEEIEKIADKIGFEIQSKVFVPKTRHFFIIVSKK